ncbi:TetR/AcrR family transcriptional regulator [Arthrobacter humicola]
MNFPKESGGSPPGADAGQQAGSGHSGRRARSEQKILDATRQLLGEEGFGSLTVEGVAARAGVAKTTIYRRYRSRNDLALAVLLDMVGDVSTRPYVGDAATELAQLVDRTVELMCTSVMGRIMKGLVSEIAADPELAQVYRERVVSHRLADVSALVEHGIARGELRAGLDAEVVTDILLGPIYYRFFLSGAPMDSGFGKRLVATLLPSFTA